MITSEKPGTTLWRIIFNRYGYISMAAIAWAVLSAVLFLGALTFSFSLVIPLATSASFAMLAFILWLRHSPHLRQATPPTPSLETLFEEIRSGDTPVLISLESDYCAYCMTVGKRIHQLEHEENLRLFRLSVHSEPGRSLVEQFGATTTPTYLLMDNNANLLQEWTIALPIERVRYDVRRQTATYKAIQAS